MAVGSLSEHRRRPPSFKCPVAMRPGEDAEPRCYSDSGSRVSLVVDVKLRFAPNSLEGQRMDRYVRVPWQTAEFIVPGLGVEPRRARGPRDFKATGRGQRTKDLDNSLPFSRPYGPRSALQSEDYGHPGGHLSLPCTSSRRAGRHRDGQPRLTARDGVARTPAESQPRFPENQRPARALGLR